MSDIDLFNYIKSLGNNTTTEIKNFEDIKKELAELYEYEIIFEELDKSRFFESENSMHIGNDSFLKSRLIISEIKEKKELLERINSLGYNIGLLRAAVLTEDKKKINKTVGQIIKNPYSSINSIIDEMGILKSKIDELENLHLSLLNSELSLDIKTLMEQDFVKKHKKLNEIYYKQKDVLVNLSSIFSKLVKDHVINKKPRKG